MDLGIDVSHYNSISDPHAARQNGVTFAWCKATEGTTTDPTFATKVAQLRAAGIVVGAYHFARAGDPAVQARYFAQVATEAGCLAVGALMPMLDMESADVRGAANSVVTAFADALNVWPLDVYGNLDWWENVLRPSGWGSRMILGHIARYNNVPGQPGWSYPRMAVHQYTDTGSVPGVAGNVDRNALMAGYDLAAITIGHLDQGGNVTTPAWYAEFPAGMAEGTWAAANGLGSKNPDGSVTVNVTDPKVQAWWTAVSHIRIGYLADQLVPGVDADAKAGFVQALAAIAALPAGQPPTDAQMDTFTAAMTKALPGYTVNITPTSTTGAT